MQSGNGDVRVGPGSLFEGSSDSAKRYETFMAASSPEEEDGFQIDAYRATIREITPEDRTLLHELTLSVFWRHRARDLDVFISLGKGYIALDEIGRAMGSAMYFPIGSDFAMCGLMVTTPRLQAQGAGRRLLRRILEDCAGRDLRLSATKSGYWLYESAGFIPVSTIWQQEGVARPIRLPEAVTGLGIRPLTADDRDAIHALDAHSYGAERTEILDRMLALSEGVVAEVDGTVTGFALLRPFGRGWVIGPVVASDNATAMHLCAPLVRRCEGQYLRVDTPRQDDQFKAFLSAAGLGVVDTVTEMHIGPARRATDGAVLYGLAAHSLG